jgi:hypothetical protein
VQSILRYLGEELVGEHDRQMRGWRSSETRRCKACNPCARSPSVSDLASAACANCDTRSAPSKRAGSSPIPDRSTTNTVRLSMMRLMLIVEVCWPMMRRNGSASASAAPLFYNEPISCDCCLSSLALNSDLV